MGFAFFEFHLSVVAVHPSSITPVSKSPAYNLLQAIDRPSLKSHDDDDVMMMVHW
jgi:hypothetical protein